MRFAAPFLVFVASLGAVNWPIERRIRRPFALGYGSPEAGVIQTWTYAPLLWNGQGGRFLDLYVYHHENQYLARPNRYIEPAPGIGEFDLSIGSMIGFAGMMVAIPSVYFHWPLFILRIMAICSWSARRGSILSSA